MIYLFPSLSTDGSWKVFICLDLQNNMNCQALAGFHLNWRIVRSTGYFSSAWGLWTLTWGRTFLENAYGSMSPGKCVSQGRPPVRRSCPQGPQTWGRTRRIGRRWTRGWCWTFSSPPLWVFCHPTLSSFSAKKENHLQPTRCFPCWILSCTSNSGWLQLVFLFSCPGQLNRWHCHWLSEWVTLFDLSVSRAL